MKKAYIIGVAILSISQLVNATSTGVYFCHNDDQTILAHLSCQETNDCQLALNGDDFSFMSSGSDLLRVLEAEDAFGIQAYESTNEDAKFAQLIIDINAKVRATMMGIKGRLLVGHALGLQSHDMVCDSFFN